MHSLRYGSEWWTPDTYILANIDDRLQNLTHIELKTTGNKAPKFKPFPRPGEKDVDIKVVGGASMPQAEVEAIMAMNGWDMPDYATMEGDATDTEEA